MGLSTREVLIILRARDLASRDIAQVGMAFSTLEGQSKAAALAHIQEGTALAGIGVAMGIAGAAGLKFYGDSLKAAVEYNKEVAYTATQVDNGAQKLQQLGQIGIDVASKIPAPFKEMQASLYDIFSSTDANIQQAQTLLEAFAKGAVAGQTDVQTAGRATISVMNAFKIPFEDVNHVMDVQFNTVKLGVITYEQLASTIGRAIPSAVRAGQSFEDLGGMIAFMTRNGLSAAQAATSAARALDMLSNPVFKENMDNIGISVTNADGAFRPMVDIVTDLKNRFGDLAPAQRTLEFLRLGGQGSADALKELGINAYDAMGNLRPFNDVSAELTQHFKGMSEADVSQELANITHGAGGTIQAMRFLNLAVGDSKNLYQSLTNAIRNSGGAAEAAYQLMRATPAMQVQLLSNQWDILKKEIGDGLIPIFSKFIGKVNDVLHWFLNLDDKTKNLIATIGLVTSVFLTLTGIFVAVAGGIQILVGLFALLDGAMLPILGWVALSAALAAAIIFLAAKTQFFQKAVEDLKSAWDAFIGGFQNPGAINNANSILITLGEDARKLVDLFILAGKDIQDFVHTYIIPSLNLIRDAFRDGGLEGAIREAGALIEHIFLPMVVSGLGKVYDYLKTEPPKWAAALWGWIEDAGPPAAERIGRFIAFISGEVAGGASTLFDNFKRNWGPALWQWIQDETPVAVIAIGNFGSAIIDWLRSHTPGVINALHDWGVALVTWISDGTPGAVGALSDWLVAILNWIRVNIQTVENELANWAVKLVEWISVATPLAILKLDDLLGVIINYIVNTLTPAVADAVAAIGIAAAEAFARGLVGIPIALGQAFTQPMRDAMTQQSQFAGQTKIDWDTIQTLIHEKASSAALDLDLLHAGGMNVKDAFTQIAQQSPETAQAIIDAMQRAGIDTNLYKDVLKQVEDEHAKVAHSAEDAMAKARSAANQYRGDLDLLLGSINGVQSATAQFDLAVASLSRQVDSNTTSTASNTEKQALMQQAFDSVYQSALTLIATVKEHGLQTDADKEAVGRAISAMEDMKAKNPGQADALQLVIDKLNELANIPDIHKENTVTTTYTTNNVTNDIMNPSASPGGDYKGGVVGYALAQGGMVKAAMGVITGFKTKGPTLVGEGNPNYPEFVIATDPAYRNRNIKLFNQAGHALNLYAQGGQLSQNPSSYLNNLAQLNAVEWLFNHVPKATEQLTRTTGGVDNFGLLGAASQVQGALGDFAGIPGTTPSTSMIVKSLTDADSMLNGMGISGAQNNTASIHIENMNINGAQDPEAVGNEVTSQLNELLQQLRVRN